MGAHLEDHYDTVVVGGGQAGLATGYHLQRHGRSFVILDAGHRVGDPWRARWDSLRLFTPARYNGLPGLAFAGPASSFPTKDEVADYLETYATRMSLPMRLNTVVDGLDRHDGRYLVSVAGRDRPIHADHVVVATGAVPRTPPFAGALDPGIVQLHSAQYRRPLQLQPGPVLVVGAGNSGSEIAMELASHHQVWLSGRDPGKIPLLTSRFYWWLIHRRLNVDSRAGRWFARTKNHGTPRVRIRLRDLSQAGVQRVPRTEGVEAGRPRLADGRVLDVANVIWCTGFAVDYSWIRHPVAGDDGLPDHYRGVARNAPGLYFVGLPFQYTLTSGLVGGVGRDAGYVVQHIAARPRPAHVASTAGT